MQTVIRTLAGLSLAALFASASAALAEEGPSPFWATEEVLTLEELGALAGGTGVNAAVLTEQTLNASNGGNRVAGEVVGSGQISLGSNAFAGYSGLGNFVLNTGHNNNLQSSMSVSIMLMPPGE